MFEKLSYKITICILICLGLGISSGFSTASSITDWFQYLQKPSWNPPNWLFGPVWTILYTMMGISVAMIWHSKDDGKKAAIIFFMIQFILNLLWSHLFFNIHAMGWAFAEIILMALFIFMTIIYFFKINKNAAYLLVPYLLWVSFASILNYSIWTLNP